MTIERGDTMFDVRPEDLEPEVDPDPEPAKKPEPEPRDLGIAATLSRRSLRAMIATTSFRRRPSRYQ